MRKTAFSIILTSIVDWRQETGVLSDPLCSGRKFHICATLSAEDRYTLCEFQLPLLAINSGKLILVLMVFFTPSLSLTVVI